VHHCGKIKSALILLMHSTNMKKTILLCLLYVHFVELVKENKFTKMHGVSSFKIMSADVYRNPFCNPVNEKWYHHGLKSTST
jgi:hypothetical protein